MIGIADGYDEALFLVEEIVQDVYQETKSANARQFLLTDQAEYEKKGGRQMLHIILLILKYLDFDTCFSRTYVSCSYNSSFAPAGYRFDLTAEEFGKVFWESCVSIG